MSDKNSTDRRVSPMSEERFAAIVAAYGASPARWPAGEREAAERFLSGRNSEAVTLAAKLDVALDGAERVTSSPALEQRIMAAFDATAARRQAGLPGYLRRMTARLRDAVWPGVPVWQPAAVLAASLMIGIVTGSFVPLAAAGEGGADREVGIALDAPPSFDLTGDF